MCRLSSVAIALGEKIKSTSPCMNGNFVDGAEMEVQIPHWRTVADTYCGATRIIHAILGTKELSGRKFESYRPDEVACGDVHLLARTKKALAQLAEKQGNPKLLKMQVQFGGRYAGKAPHEVVSSLSKREFALGAFEGAAIILQVAELLSNEKDRWMSTPGSLMASCLEPHLSSVGYAYHKGELQFASGAYAVPQPLSGVATGFIV